MDDQRLWKILLGGVLPTFGRLPDTPRPESHPITVMPALPSPRALAIERATLTSGRDPVFYFPAYLRYVSLSSTKGILLTVIHIGMAPCRRPIPMI
jgi:hypothetical protein